MNRLSLVLLALTTALFTVPAQAYSLFLCSDRTLQWENPSQAFDLHPQNFTPLMIDEVKSAASYISSARGTQANITMIDTNQSYTTPDNYGDGRNSVSMLDSGSLDGRFGQAKLGFETQCDNIDTSGRLLEVDVSLFSKDLFDQDIFWTHEGGATRPLFSVGTTIAHEFGHAFGLDHDWGTDVAMMNACASSATGLGGSSITDRPVSKFHGQDVKGLRRLYPNADTGHDIYLSTGYREFGSRCPIESVVLHNSQFYETLQLVVGEQYRFNYTVGNLGTEGAEVNVKFHYSEGEDIVYFDPELGPAHTIFLAAGQSASGVFVFNAPDIPEGVYSLGFSVDPTGDIDTVDNRARLNGLYFISNRPEE